MNFKSFSESLPRIRIVHLPKTIDNDYRIDFIWLFYGSRHDGKEFSTSARMHGNKFVFIETMGEGWMAPYGVDRG